MVPRPLTIGYSRRHTIHRYHYPTAEVNESTSGQIIGGVTIVTQSSIYDTQQQTNSGICDNSSQTVLGSADSPE